MGGEKPYKDSKSIFSILVYYVKSLIDKFCKYVDMFINEIKGQGFT